MLKLYDHMGVELSVGFSCFWGAGIRSTPFYLLGCTSLVSDTIGGGCKWYFDPNLPAHPTMFRQNPMTWCLLTDTELRRLHKRFGHPSADKLHSLLRHADITEPDLRQTLEAISKECEHCQRNAQAPRRFKFAYHDENEFNHTIYVDVFYINGRPVLHVVDEATKYQAARWLPISASAIWQSHRACWIDVYVCPPDIIAHDAGKGFVADESQASSNMLKIDTKPTVYRRRREISRLFEKGI